MVIGELVAFPFPEAQRVLRAWRDMTVSAPDELMLVAALLTAPDGSGNKIVAVAACHCGAEVEGNTAAAKIKSFGTLAMDAMGPISYSALNGMLDAGYPSGALYYWKSAFIPTPTDAAIDALISAYERCPVPTSQILVENFHGAASRAPVNATAYALRDSGFNTLVLGQWADPADGDATRSWCRETYGVIQPFIGERRYMNYLDADEDMNGAAVAAYGPNLARLRQFKKRYDPKNVFHQNLNILPA